MQKNERTLKMMEQFMALHNDGKDISEIADLTGVSKWTVYDNLQAIADQNGVSREELLQRVHAPHTVSGQISKPVRKLDLSEWESKLPQMRQMFAENNAMINEILKENRKEDGNVNN